MTRREGEFAFIKRVMAPLAGLGALSLRDDAALYDVSEGKQLVLSTDTLVENVHFLSSDPPETLGRKLLRVNLSDCAAMGARARAYLLNLTCSPCVNNTWLEAFASGLAQDQKIYDVALLGGDTTRTHGPITLSATILGEVDRDRAVLRSGAQAGDELWLSGTLGDAALGLRALRNEIPDPEGFFIERYRLPSPRVSLALGDIASAALDISDGLVQDAGHMAQASEVTLEIRAASIPQSTALMALGKRRYLETCLTGGDDYELLIACPPHRRQTLLAEGARANVRLTHVGEVSAGAPQVRVLDANAKPMQFKRGGWQHF